ncbi:MAG: PilZ domain-containing protein [Methylovirgula sp.]
MDTDMNVPNAGSERRTSDRVRTFLRAQIIFNNRMTTIDCIVKNISATGARVALNNTLAVPTEFDIYIPQRGRSHHARLVWRDKDSIGIGFMDVQQPAAVAAPPSLPDMPALGGEARLRELEVQNAELKARIRQLNKRLEDLGQDPNNVL